MRGPFVGPHLGMRVEKEEPVIEMSPAQRERRINKLRAELFDLGYSVVKTEWFTFVTGNQTRKVG